MSVRRKSRSLHHTPLPGSTWIKEHRSELPGNHWVAADDTGLVSQNKTHDGLMSDLRTKPVQMDRVVIAFIEGDQVGLESAAAWMDTLVKRKP